MNIFRLAFEILVLYLLYKFIFEFVIPVYRSTRQMKDQMRNMQEKMKENMQSPPKQQQASPVSSTQKINREDYIDYEEIK